MVIDGSPPALHAACCRTGMMYVVCEQLEPMAQGVGHRAAPGRMSQRAVEPGMDRVAAVMAARGLAKQL